MGAVVRRKPREIIRRFSGSARATPLLAGPSCGMPRMCRAIRRSSDEPAQRRQTIDNRCIEGSDFNANRLTIPRVVRNLWVTPPIPDADVDEEPRLLDDMSDGCHRDGEY